jgi:hypothetical protein
MPTILPYQPYLPALNRRVDVLHQLGVLRLHVADALLQERDAARELADGEVPPLSREG